jgi:hypothetical protein
MLNGLFCKKVRKDGSNFFPSEFGALFDLAQRQAADFSNTAWRGQKSRAAAARAQAPYSAPTERELA